MQKYLCINKSENRPSYVNNLLGVICDCYGIEYSRFVRPYPPVETRIDNMDIFVAEGCWWCDDADVLFSLDESLAERVLISILRVPESERLKTLTDFMFSEEDIGKTTLAILTLAQKHKFGRSGSRNWGL